MSGLIPNNWWAKLLCLILASAIWYLVRKNAVKTPFPSEWIHRSVAYLP